LLIHDKTATNLNSKSKIVTDMVPATKFTDKTQDNNLAQKM